MYNQIQQQQQPMMGGVNYGMPQVNYGMPAMGGVMYNQNQQQVQMTNPLGARAGEMLKNGTGQPKLQITQEDYDQAICTHRYNNELQLLDLGNNRVRCKICGAEFEVIDNVTKEDIEKCAENMTNLMHTAKTMWLNSSDQTTQEYFQIIPVIKQAPKIFSIAQDVYNKCMNVNPIQQNGITNGYAVLNNIVGPYGMGMGMAPQYPMYGYGMPQQPMMNQQTPVQMQPMYQPTQMQSAMTAGAPGLVNTGFGYVQQPQQAPMVGQAPAPAPEKKDETVVVTSQLHV